MMNYQKIKECIKTIEGISTIESEYDNYIKFIEEVNLSMNANQVNDPVTIDRVLTATTGVYGIISIAYGFFEWELSFTKERLKSRKKDDIISSNKSDQYLHKLGSFKHTLYRVMSTSDKIIGTCQSKIKLLDKERTLG